MRTPSYLMKNSFGIWHLRLAVPKHIRYIIGKREIKKTLRTGNEREALRKARKLAVQYQEKFDRMSEIDDILNNPLFQHLKCSIVRHPDGTVEMKDVEMDPEHPDAEMRMLDHAVQKINEIIPAEAQQVSSVAKDDAPSILLSDLVQEYLNVVSNTVDNDKTLNGYRSHLQTFVEILGDVPINTVDRKRARESVSILKQLPPNRNKLNAYKDLSIAAIIQMKPPKVLSPTTVKLYVERITALFQFAVEEEYLEKNPYVNIHKAKKTVRSDQERKKFDDKDLSALFSPANMISKPGCHSRDWINYISAYSGLRLEEIAQMDASDIKNYNGIDCFDINDSNGKKLKNLSANRVVPIHSKLLSKYFLLFVQGQRGGKLFPELTKANGKYGHHYSKWFKRYRERCGVIDPGKSLHSFRHNVATQFKQNDIPVEKAAAILGHAVNGQTYGRYGKMFRVEQLRDVIETIDYGNLIP